MNPILREQGIALYLRVNSCEVQNVDQHSTISASGFALAWR